MYTSIQTDAFIEYQDFSGQKIMIGMSGGINSMAVLCFLATEYPKEKLPKELHLFYAHFEEHSGDTFDFVKAGVAYAERQFPTGVQVVYKNTWNSVNTFFGQQRTIPHPTNSMCSRVLKREVMMKYLKENEIDFDLVGFVRHEKGRMTRQQSYNNDESNAKVYPITTMTDEDCEAICEREIGWVPAIYKIKENGKRVFKHNNCLPCKNMHDYQLKKVKEYYPDRYARALQTAKDLGQHWGRKDEVDELICPTCDWD